MAITTVFLGTLLLSFNHLSVSERIVATAEVNTSGKRSVDKSLPSLADDRRDDRDGWDDHDNNRHDNDRRDHHDDDRHDHDDDDNHHDHDYDRDHDDHDRH